MRGFQGEDPNIKIQNPKKLQRNPKFQTPNSNEPLESEHLGLFSGPGTGDSFESPWCLELGAYLVFGSWSLVFLQGP
jgi:hypothetical protein